MQRQSMATYPGNQLSDSVEKPVSIGFALAQRKKMKLLEVNPELMKIVESGEDLYIKGSKSEEAVLCSGKQTFSLKRVETSNSVFLVPSSSGVEFHIAGRCIDYYETKLAKGKTDNLRFIVSDLISQVGSGLRKEDVYKHVQASGHEIDSTLQNIGVVETSSGLRVLEAAEIVRATQSLFNGIMRNGLPIKNLQPEECVAVCDDIDGEVLKYVLTTLGTNNGDVWCLDELKMGKAAVRVIFHEIKTMSKDTVKQEWLLITPGATEFNDHVIRGLCVEIIDTPYKGSQKVLHYLPVDDLPTDPSIRLEKLFSLKSRYEISELVPYFSDLIGGAGQPKTVEEILLSRTRLVDGQYLKK